MSDNAPEDTTPGSAPVSEPVQGDPVTETPPVQEPSADATSDDDDDLEDDEDPEDEDEVEDDDDDEGEGGEAA